MKLHDPYKEGYKRLLEYLKRFHNAVVAFSGGTDSTFLLLVAKEVLGNNVIALTVKTSYIPDWEIEEALAFCQSHSIRHKIIEFPFPETIRENPEDRCYKCKRQLFEKLLEEAASAGI